jgi:3'-5' exoribonuclease
MSKTNVAGHRVISDLQPGQRLEDEIYLLIQKDLRTTTTGSLYIHAILADQTGQIVARMWNASREIYESMPLSGLIYVQGRVESYKGKPQFIIDGVRTVEEGKADPADFLPVTQRDIEKMWSRVTETLRAVKSPDLLALLGKFINDEWFVAAFKRAPAARTNHHAYLGGLLEHTLNLLELAVVVLPRYPDVSADLVLTGIFLHDAGKTTELAYETTFEYTNEGQLVGHIVQTAIWVAQKARELEVERGQPFPPDLLATLQHVVVAHHGRYEFGSPRLPATAEAIMVHYLDNLDAKLAMVFEAIEADVDPESDWTGWVPALESRVFKPDPTKPRSENPK